MILVMSCLLSSTIVVLISANIYGKNQYNMISGLANAIIQNYPEEKEEILTLIKKSSNIINIDLRNGEDYLSDYGYKEKDFAKEYINQSIIYTIVAVILFLCLILFLLKSLKEINKKEIDRLTQYLEKINMDKQTSILSSTGENFSQLEDEIYKTVTNLRQTKDAAIKAKKNFADNLANISHQIKTPITSISIMAQLLKDEWNEDHIKQINKQSIRLNQLAESLLTLSRIDAGVLTLEESQIDIYTMLQLSIEVLDEMISKKEIELILPNHEDVTYQGDMEWSIEAFINLIKNSIEHTANGGCIFIDYFKNPLYIEIQIKDNGAGISAKDLPHIFKRYYRGKEGGKTGIGIGLSLAKSLIEMQNGLIHVKNMPEGGACFVVRFYHH